MIGIQPEKDESGVLLDWAFDHGEDRFCMGVERNLGVARLLRRLDGNTWENVLDYDVPATESGIKDAGGFNNYLAEFALMVTRKINEFNPDSGETEMPDPNSQLGQLIAAIQNDMIYIDEGKDGGYVRYEQ